MFKHFIHPRIVEQYYKKIANYTTKWKSVFKSELNGKVVFFFMEGEGGLHKGQSTIPI